MLLYSAFLVVFSRRVGSNNLACDSWKLEVFSLKIPVCASSFLIFSFCFPLSQFSALFFHCTSLVDRPYWKRITKTIFLDVTVWINFSWVLMHVFPFLRLMVRGASDFSKILSSWSIWPLIIFWIIVYLSNLSSFLPSESMIQISMTQVRDTNYTSNVVQLELCYIITAGIYNLLFP